jgi:hypothetical protein
LPLGDNVSAQWKNWLSQASSDWSASSVIDTPLGPGRAMGNCRPPDGSIEVCNGSYGYNGWLGIAQIWASGDHIVKAVAKMNDTYHNLAPYNSDGWRDMVMCQEVGHTFGLGHQDEAFGNGNLGTCMDYTDNPDGSPPNRAPNAHDYGMLDAIYDHLESSGGGTGGSDCNPKSPKCAAAPPPAAFDMELSGPGQWGREIAASAEGGQSVFVQEFGNGYRVYTHVTWTLEAAAGRARGRR